MPAFITWLLGGLSIVLKYVAARVVFMLGIQVVTITGVAVVLNDLKDAFISTYTGLPATMLQVLGLLRIDQACLVIFSAITARYTLGLAGGGFSRIVQGAPPEGRL